MVEESEREKILREERERNRREADKVEQEKKGGPRDGA